ncbi:hypothetical protein R1flu_001837 [Riccia fluitans]|uniref:Uncharacterized protein n=1 Tax=Riccia fluitans TaxID=41844 RepID=A0ABD1Y7R7_9MARC
MVQSAGGVESTRAWASQPAEDHSDRLFPGFSVGTEAVAKIFRSGLARMAGDRSARRLTEVFKFPYRPVGSRASGCSVGVRIWFGLFISLAGRFRAVDFMMRFGRCQARLLAVAACVDSISSLVSHGRSVPLVAVCSFLLVFGRASSPS